MAEVLQASRDRARPLRRAGGRTYEGQIAAERLDATAREAFEEDLLDRMPVYWICDFSRKAHPHNAGKGENRGCLPTSYMEAFPFGKDDSCPIR